MRFCIPLYNARQKAKSIWILTKRALLAGCFSKYADHGPVEVAIEAGRFGRSGRSKPLAPGFLELRTGMLANQVSDFRHMNVGDDAVHG